MVSYSSSLLLQLSWWDSTGEHGGEECAQGKEAHEEEMDKRRWGVRNRWGGCSCSGEEQAEEEQDDGGLMLGTVASSSSCCWSLENRSGVVLMGSIFFCCSCSRASSRLFISFFQWMRS